MATAKNSSTKKSSSTVSKKQYDEMQKQMEALQELVNKLMGGVATNEPTPVQNITQYIGDNNKDVPVTSLTVGQLNLSTEGYGRGAIYTFEQIGEEQVIPYEDLKKIIKNNKSFVEGGNFFINDDEVIKNQRLTNVYKKLLSYDEMQDLFSKDRAAFEKIFTNMTENQKETLKRIIFEKLEQNEKNVDMNIVQVINEDMNIDIMKDFRSRNNYLDN